MAVTKTFEEQEFQEVAKNEGSIHMTVFGEEQSMDYTAKSFINSEGNILYVDITGQDDKQGFVFLSKISDGDVITMPGDQSGEFPFPVENAIVRTAEEGGEVGAFYTEHLTALGGQDPLNDPQGLKAESETLPQRSVDIGMKALQALMGGEGMGDMMQQMMQGMTEAFGEMGGEGEGMEAMGEMMAGMMQGMAEGLGEGGEGEGMEGLGELMAQAMGEAFSQLGGVPDMEGGQAECSDCGHVHSDDDKCPECSCSGVPEGKQECPACGCYVDDIACDCPDCGEEL